MAQTTAVINDPTTWHAFATPFDPELSELMKTTKPRFTQDHQISCLPETRKRWHALWEEDARQALEAARDEVTQEEIFIPTRDGTKVRALVFRPKLAEPAKDLPLAIIIHGGGFCLGNAEMEADPCIRATKAYGCVSLSLEYRLSPENKFPVAYEDCWDALLWLSKNAACLGCDLKKGFVFGGTSAGGHISMPLSHRARDEGLEPPLTGVYLSITPSLPPQALTEKYKPLYGSRDQLSNGVTLTAKATNMYDVAVEPDFKSPLWNPLLWPTGHANMPSTFFQICGADLLRDEALIYERELRKEHGVNTKAVVYQGLPHVFWYNYPTHSQAEKYYVDAARGIGWLLGKET